MPLLEARVKSVLSGDTLVLTHVTNRSQERILSLAYVSAPRLKREGDEVSVMTQLVFVCLTGLICTALCICPVYRYAVMSCTYSLYGDGHFN